MDLERRHRPRHFRPALQRRAEVPSAPYEFAVNTTTTGNQTSPVVTALNNGNFVVAWLSGGIFAQTYDANGVKVGSQLTLNSAATNAQNEAITALSDGGYLVTWTSGSTVFAEHFSASGSPIGSQFTVTTAAGGASSVTALSGGGFLVTWTGSDSNIHGQQFDATGATVGDPQSSHSGGNSHPVLATLANNDVVLTWTGSDGVGNGTGITGQFFAGAQTQSNADSYRPVISPDGRYIVFASDAALVPGDTNGQTDTYIYDRWTQSVSLVSQTAAGQLGFAIEALGNGVNSGGFVSAFGGAALAFNQGTASKAGSVITFANSSLSDFNPDAGTITLTLTAHGTLHAVSSGGLTIVQDGSGGTLEVTGSLTAINAALHAGVNYTPDSAHAGGPDTLTLNAVDTTGDGTTQVVSFDNSLSTSVSPITGTPTDSFITNVYAVDSSTGASGAVLDDARALTYVDAPPENVNAQPVPNPVDPLAPARPGFVFGIPTNQNVLQSADFNVFSTGATGQAHTFRLALYEWNGSNVVGAAIFTTGPFNLQDSTNTPITDFPLNALNIPVDSAKQYVWEIIADGTVTTSTPAALNFAPALTTSGALGFVDSNDTHTVSVASHSGDWGNLIAWVATDTTGTNQDGKINWAYEVNPQAAAALTIGQTHTDTFTVTLIDSAGNPATRDVTVTVIGTNEVPQLSFASAVSSFEFDRSTSHPTQRQCRSAPSTKRRIRPAIATAHSASGSFTFTDFNAAGVDAADSHSVTAELASSEWKSAGGAVLSFDTPQNADLLQSVALFADTADTNNPSATFAAWLQSDASNSSPGDVDWHFQLPDNALDFLAAGETLTLVYNVTLTNSHLASDTRQVTVTVTGTDDAPVITTADPQVGITEQDLTTGSATADTASGSLAFTDVDLSETGHTAAVTQVQASGVTSGAPDDTTLLSFLNTGTVVKDAGSSDGTIAWGFSAPDQTFDYLAVGEHLTLQYTVQVTDASGATGTQTVTVTVTGTDDAPVITTADPQAGITEQDLTTGSATADTASGSLAFTDVDLSETGHTAAVTQVQASGVTSGAPDDTTLLSFLNTGTVVKDAGSSDGTIAWGFSAPDQTFDYLAVGEHLTLQYTVQVTDASGATGTQTVTVTVTGTDDAPVITTADPQVGITEQDLTTGSATADTASGSLAFTDVDLSETGHTAAVTQVQASGVTSGAPDDTTLLSFLNTGTVVKDAGSSDGTIAWGFSAPDQTFDYLAVGEHLTLQYTVQVTDASGATGTQTVTVTVTGTDDAPVITTADPQAGITEQDLTTGSATADTASGSLAFTDVDLSETGHTAAVTQVQASGVTSGAPDDTTLLSFLNTGTVVKDAGSSDGTIAWGFSAPDQTFDYLAVGEHLTLQYTVQVTDASGATGTQTVTVTVTGTDDAPVITTADPQAGITEQDLTTGSATADTASGSLAFTDVDLSETGHTAAVTQVQASGVTSGAPDDTTLLSFLNTGTVVKDAGSSDGTIAWGFSAPDQTFDYLAVGEHLTLQYTVQVTDASGATGTQTVTVTVTGTDDAPTISATSDGFSEQAGTNNAGNDTASGHISFTDVDLSDRPTVTAPFASSYTYLAADGITSLTLTTPQEIALETALAINPDGGNANDGSATWTYTVADNALDFLAAGETLTLIYTATVNDHNGGVVTTPIDVTITGTNDAPIITNGPVTGALQEDGDGTTTYQQSASGTLAATDADHNANLTWSVTGTGAVASQQANYSFAIDNFTIVKDTLTIVDDDMSSAPVAGGGDYAVGVNGTTGVLTSGLDPNDPNNTREVTFLDASTALPSTSFNTGDATVANGAIRLTGTDRH